MGENTVGPNAGGHGLDITLRSDITVELVRSSASDADVVFEGGGQVVRAGRVGAQAIGQGGAFGGGGRFSHPRIVGDLLEPMDPTIAIQNKSFH